MSDIIALCRRKKRNRFVLKSKNNSVLNRKRLVVFRSNKNIYAQIIDDNNGNVIVSSSTLEKSFKSKNLLGANVEAAKYVGSDIAKKALDLDIKNIIFDRGGYLYHGRVKALAESARMVGLEF